MPIISFLLLMLMKILFFLVAVKEFIFTTFKLCLFKSTTLFYLKLCIFSFILLLIASPLTSLKMCLPESTIFFYYLVPSLI